jgi:poly-gamma-glutamate capsule biosynthesis protein CapA/YwtB (metallophosphatase superfamily)
MKADLSTWELTSVKIAGMGLGIIFFLLVLLINAQSSATTKESPQDQVITIAAVGDIMMGSDFPSPNLPPEDGKLLFKEVADILSKADISFGNLEGPLCDGGATIKDTNHSNIFAFRTPTRFAANLKAAGLKVVSVANNHAMDFGYYGKLSTQRALKQAGVKYSGQEGGVAEFEVGGVKIAVISLSFGPPPRSIVHPQAALAEIEALAKKYDILLVSIHGGREGWSAQHVDHASEYFLGEARGNLVKFAHDAIDRGAHLIIGHGPHVPRAVEVYKKRLLAYSLGNFCTYKGMNLTGESGYAPLLWVELNNQGKFLRGKIYSFIQPRPGGPQPDEQARAFKLMRTLSLEDFPESCPLFAGSTTILPLAGKDEENKPVSLGAPGGAPQN